MKFRTFLQKKLWRDKMVARAESQGSRLNWRRLDDEEFDLELRRKIVEEGQEVCSAFSRQELVSELADVFDVIDELCRVHGISREEVAQHQQKKCQERGGFVDRMYVEAAAHPEGSYLEKYCLDAPEKYPEVK